MTAAVAWFRRDLRLTDNPALLDAVAKASSTSKVVVIGKVSATSGGSSVSSTVSGGDSGATGDATSQPAAVLSSGQGMFPTAA